MIGKKHDKCSNCLYFIKESQKMGLCKKMKGITGYMFKYKPEEFNLDELQQDESIRTFGEICREINSNESNSTVFMTFS